MDLAGVVRWVARAGAVMALMAVGTSQAVAQGGVVAGTVVDDREAPVVGARVALQGTLRTATTDARGRFRLEGVAAGSVTLRVTAIGYAPATQTAQSGDEQLTIKLAVTVFSLSDVVVTGTAGGEEKRAIGNTVATLAASEIQTIAPAADFSGLLNGRVSNVVLQATAGQVGGGGKLRVRGITSVSLSNDPLIYIDGVRADNATGRGITFVSTSRFNDIDPNDIESIEVIKGPAAATLYGTEASAGVIQIITKKGRQGKAEFGFETSQGAAWVPNPEGLFERNQSYFRDAQGNVQGYNVVRQESDSGRPLFRTGHRQRYALDVRGGTQGIQYYASGSLDDDEGVVAPNAVRRWNLRANVQATITPKLTFSVNTGFVSSRNNIPDYELLRGAYNAFPALRSTVYRGFLVYPPEVSRQFFSNIEDLSRTTMGAQLNHSPNSWFTHRVNVGVDDVNEELDVLRQFISGPATAFFSAVSARGADTLYKREATLTTVDYGATATRKLTSSISSKTSAGFQFYRRFVKTGQLSGTGFPAPGVTTISSAATKSSLATFVENKTVGVFAQQQFGFKDRFFLTAALRADDNSAFGTNFDLVTYPKVSASWVLSDEPFWPNLFSTFRVRGAFGKSGQQPDQFAALRSYQPVPGPGGLPAVRPQFVGNPDLGPERGRELEGGFEAALFNDRIGVDVTYFNKRTEDAILARNVAPSEGFPAQQFVNVGTVSNKGIEIQVNGNVVSNRNLKVDLTFALSHTTNKLVETDGIDNLAAGINQFHRVGFPVGAFFAKKVLSAEIGANGQPTNILCDAGDGKSNPTGQSVACALAPTVYMGQPLPKYEGAFNATVQVGQRLTLSGLADFKTGGRNFNADIAIQCAILRLCLYNVDPSTDVISSADQTIQTFGVSTTPEVRFLKIRSLSASYRMPEKWAAWVGGTAATITFTARNLKTFTNFKQGPDPELGAVFVGSPHNQEAFQQIPMPFQFITTFRVTF